MEQQDTILTGVDNEAPPRRGPGRPSRSNAELLDLSLELFHQNGFERTSIDAICAAAGMAKRTVYARYGDKATLFKAALKRAIEHWIVPIERLRAAEVDDFEETLARIADILVANIMSQAGLRLLRLTNAESGLMPDVGVYAVQHGTEPTLRYLADLFRRKGGLGDSGMPNADDAAQAFLYLVVGGLANNAAWGAAPDRAAIERHTRYTLQIFLHGIRPARDGGGGGGDGGGSGGGGGDLAALEEDNLRLKKLLAETMIQLDQARNPAA